MKNTWTFESSFSLNSTVQKTTTNTIIISKERGNQDILQVRPKHTKGNIFVLSADSLNQGFWLGQMSVFILPEFLCVQANPFGVLKFSLQDTSSISNPFNYKRMGWITTIVVIEDLGNWLTNPTSVKPFKNNKVKVWKKF